MVKCFAAGVDKTEFQSILMSGKSAVGADVSISAVSLSPPTVNLDRAFSSLSGLYATRCVHM